MSRISELAATNRSLAPLLRQKRPTRETRKRITLLKTRITKLERGTIRPQYEFTTFNYSERYIYKTTISGTTGQGIPVSREISILSKKKLTVEEVRRRAMAFAARKMPSLRVTTRDILINQALQTRAS